MRPPAAPREVPPPLELQCLKALLTIGEGTVRTVQEALLAGERKLAYTTVMTVLDRLEKRGCVARRKQGRSFIYFPKVSREALQGAAVKELVEQLFDGSEEVLARFLRSREKGARGHE